MAVFIFERTHEAIDAGVLKEEIIRGLGIKPIDDPTFEEHTTVIMKVNPPSYQGNREQGESFIYKDADLAHVEIADDFSFGNNVSVSAFRTKKDTWVDAVWVVVDPKDKDRILEGISELKEIVKKHNHVYEPKNVMSHDVQDEKWKETPSDRGTWAKTRTKMLPDGSVKEEILKGVNDGSGKHTHLIFKGTELVAENEHRGVPKESFVKQIKRVSTVSGGVVEHHYSGREGKDQKNTKMVHHRNWVQSTTSTSLTDMPYMFVRFAVGDAPKQPDN